MKLKREGKQVHVFLNVPELRQFAKVQEDLEVIAQLPCEQQKQADLTAQSLAELAESMTKVDPQQELPFDGSEDESA